MSNVATPELVIKAPELRGAALELGSCHDTEVCLDGPGGCIAGETRLYNPMTGEHVPVKELYDKKIAPIVQTLMGAIQADVPFRKGVARLYHVTLASGRQCVVTGDHRFLTPDGWRFASACAVGSRLLVSWPCPHPTTEAHGPLVSQQDALRLSQIPLNCQDGCSQDNYLYDELPQLVKDTGQVSAPSRDGALVHSHADLCKDDQVFLSVHTHDHQSVDRRARNSYPLAYTGRAYTLSHAQQGISLLVDASYRYDAPFQQEKCLPLPTAQFQFCGGNMLLREHWLDEHRFYLEHHSHGAWGDVVPEPLMRCFVSSHMRKEYPDTLPDLNAYNLSSNTSNTLLPSTNMYYTALVDTVSSIEYVRTDEYFDLHVPIAEHYLAEGIWHHNSGKTFPILYYLHVLLLKYAGAKILTSRKFNVDLAGSAMATYQNDVLNPHEGVYYYGGSKVKPPGYVYPNGSFMAVSGLDRPSKLKSFECDIVYINEATECTIDDLEVARTRLRKGVIPWQQIIMDTNPDAPTHWLNQRMNAGLTTRLLSRHEDNPRYYDKITQDWTEEGYKYIFGILGGLTGVRLSRLRYGLWVAAEGTIYEQSFDRNRNVIDRFPIPLDWPRYLCIDFGFVNPFVCGWWARDPDGRLICYREIYMTKRLVEDHVKDIKRYSRWGEEGGDPLPREIIADHDAEGRATFERHTGMYTTPAHKAVAEGIEAVASQLLPAGDGKPRLMYFRDALVERDKELSARKKPACTVEEYDTYIWKPGPGIDNTKDEPRKEDDHGMDMSRYLVARFYLRPSGVSYFPDIWT